jgi:hypothetical protein
MSVKREIRRFYADKASRDSAPLPTPSTRREPSLDEQNRVFHFQHDPLYYTYFCIHDKLRSKCTNVTCRR